MASSKQRYRAALTELRLALAMNLLLLPLLLLSLPGVVQAQLSFYTPFYYSINNGTITLTRYAGRGGAVRVPDTINGLQVISIGDQAFWECLRVTSVTIPSSVTSIGNGAFGECPRLKEIYFLGDAPSIGSDLFYGDYHATVFYLPETTGWGATLGNLSTAPWVSPEPFNYTDNNDTITITGYTGSGGDVIIPESIDGLPVTSVGNGAFSYCTSPTNVAIPKSVTGIGDTAFYSCTSLTAINVDRRNSVYSSLDGVLFNQRRTTLIQCPWGKVGSYTIPESATSIEAQAFNNCASLTSVTIPNGIASIGYATFDACFGLTNVLIGTNVTSIEDAAFYGCGLTSVSIGNNVTSIADTAFSACHNLMAITVDTNNSVYCSVDGVLFDKSTNTLIQYPGGEAGSYTIPNGVSSIGFSAFSDCFGLTNVTFPNSVTSIGTFAFFECISLTGFYFQGNAPSVGSDTFFMFYGDNNPTVYYLPGTTGWENFAQLTGLRTVLWNP